MSQESFPPGHRLGPYELITMIGRGGWGEVYRARDHRLGRDVAVKTVRGPVARDQARRLELEARATAALNHPNIIAIYDVGTESGVVYIVTELLEGESLRARLRRGRLDPSSAIAFARQIVDALVAAHAKGIVHRDLKPENVFVLPGGRIKLLDFGVAKLLSTDAAVGADVETMSALTMAGDLVGTPAYLAPEQARGLAVDHRADIFSFGVVLYEMLTGESPFRRETTADTLSAILRDEPKRLVGHAGAMPGLTRIVQRCLDKDPQARFPSATDLRFALDTIAPQPRRPVVRAKALMSAVVIVAVFIAIVWSTHKSGGPAPAPPAAKQAAAVSAPISRDPLANTSVTRMVETLRGHRFADEPSINGTAKTVHRCSREAANHRSACRCRCSMRR